MAKCPPMSKPVQFFKKLGGPTSFAKDVGDDWLVRKGARSGTGETGCNNGGVIFEADMIFRMNQG